MHYPAGVKVMEWNRECQAHEAGVLLTELLLQHKITISI